MPEALHPRLLELLEAMPDAILMVDGDGTIVQANSQALALFRARPDQLIGQSVDSLLPDRFRSGHAGHRRGFFAQPRARGMGTGLDLYGRRVDGAEFPVEISLSPIVTESGPMVLSAIRDATQRKQVEASLLQASRLKSQFLANMSHELRTPLNGIIGFAELLSDQKAGPLNPRQQGFLQDILDSGRHLLHLVNDLLDISRIEAGRMDINPSVFNLAEAIEDACTVLSTSVADKQIVLRRKVAVASGDVCQDRQKLKQILLNLVSNAIKFSEPGGEVAIRAECDASGALRLRVQDHGVGISEANLDRLFVEFERLHDSAADRRPGTGLGLALTRRLVELLGGRIDVESRPGKGSTFSVRLPPMGVPA